MAYDMFRPPVSKLSLATPISPIPASAVRRSRRHLVDVLGKLVPVVLDHQLNRPLGGTRERHALRAIPAPEHPPVGHVVALGRSTQIARRDLLQLALGVQTGGPVGTRVRVGRHAAALDTAPGQVLAGIAPDDLGLLPVGLERLHRGAAVSNTDSVPEVADALLDVDLAVGSDRQQARP